MGLVFLPFQTHGSLSYCLATADYNRSVTEDNDNSSNNNKRHVISINNNSNINDSNRNNSNSNNSNATTKTASATATKTAATFAARSEAHSSSRGTSPMGPFFLRCFGCRICLAENSTRSGRWQPAAVYSAPGQRCRECPAFDRDGAAYLGVGGVRSRHDHHHHLRRDHSAGTGCRARCGGQAVCCACARVLSLPLAFVAGH